MNKMNIMKKFILIIRDRGLLTKFINDVFNYTELHEYNYIFRIIDNNDEIIIDIYDNVSNNRFNRYIYSFIDDSYDIKIEKNDFLYIKYVSVLNIKNIDDNICKLAYLFKIEDDEMINYANSFLDNEFVEILKSII